MTGLCLAVRSNVKHLLHHDENAAHDHEHDCDNDDDDDEYDQVEVDDKFDDTLTCNNCFFQDAVPNDYTNVAVAACNDGM